MSDVPLDDIVEIIEEEELGDNDAVLEFDPRHGRVHVEQGIAKGTVERIVEETGCILSGAIRNNRQLRLFFNKVDITKKPVLSVEKTVVMQRD